MKILIMGLPNSGKTTLAKELCKRIKAIHLNADEMRNQVWPELKFTYEDRLIQAHRMGTLSNILNGQGYTVVADFVCPTSETRLLFGQSFVIWVDRIEKSWYEDTNKLFEKPLSYDIHIQNGLSVEEQINIIIKKLKEVK